MPRASRAKAARHAAAVKLPSKLSTVLPENENEFNQGLFPDSTVQEHERHDVVVPEASTSRHRRLFLPQPEPVLPSHPYSRSHNRREKRKAKQQLAGGELHSVAAALSIALGEDPSQLPTPTSAVQKQEARRKAEEKRLEDSKIKEGKGRTLSEKARRAQIKLESKRIPAVMKHPEFQKNPWAAIRLHAGNSVAVTDQSARV
ncbi:ribosome biogenesis protein SLX9-domain-containing protein [Naematelia encephala]|uniref:Ribosome biogenesis protein SLX9 n=1 Tax=Naematelia encephala TaxID=71784 RepID=A0A1Y2BL48_9TREE|nr:ribosome biogenesis protein SLX9-domain-containing protein [Naematelia encephala]